MDLSFTDAERAFQVEVRHFVAKHLTPELKRAQDLTPSVFSEPEISDAWHQALHQRGWVAPAWPTEHGGYDWSPAQRWIFETECARAGAPSISPMGVRMVGPVIIRFGSQLQKDFYLPRILSGEHIWCQGYSEPARISDIEIDIDALEMTELRVMSALQSGENPGAISSLLKLRTSEIRQAVTRLGVEVIGQHALVCEPRRPLYRLNEPAILPEPELPLLPEFLNGRAYTIFGGTSEVQRDIIAKLMLGL